MKVSGIDVSSGASVEVSFEQAITIVDHLIHPLAAAPFLAPGWIDLQVNGFAGVDYNSPSSDPEQIAQSIRAMFGCGVTRFFPTVITGSPENMTAALRNLASAKESIRGRRRDGGVPSRRSLHFAQRRPARSASGALGPPARYRGVPSLSGMPPAATFAWSRFRPNGRKPRVSSKRSSRKAWSRASATRALLPPRSPTRSAPAQRYPRILGNGADAVLPRHPNYLWEQLAEDRLAASFIVDGFHLPRVVLERRAARQRSGAVAAGHRCRHAGRLRSRPLSAG